VELLSADNGEDAVAFTLALGALSSVPWILHRERDNPTRLLYALALREPLLPYPYANTAE
jgi:hypothetical protein